VIRETELNRVNPIESTLGGPLSEIQQGRQEIIQKLADNAMKHDGTSFLAMKPCFNIKHPSIKGKSR